jgi:hypothetical protein
LAACGSSSSESSPGNDASAADGTTGAIDSGGGSDGSSGTPADGGTDASIADGGADGSITVTVNATIALPNLPGVMAQNTTTGRLYVSLQDQVGNGQGIAVIDMSSDTVLATIPQPTGSTAVYTALAVDEATNRVFGIDNFTNTVWAFDGATNTAIAPIALDSLAPAGTTGNGVTGIAIDSSAHVLYAGVLFEDANNNSLLSIAVIDPASGDAGTSASLISTTQVSSSLAIDPQNHLLFVCGLDSSGTSYKTSVTRIDTTTRTPAGAPLTWPSANASPVGPCLALPGFGEWVTIDVIQQSSSLHLLEPKDQTLPSGFTPTANAVENESALGYVGIFLFGIDEDCKLSQVTAKAAGGEAYVSQSRAPLLAPTFTGYTIHGVVPGPAAGQFYVTPRPNTCSVPIGDAGSFQIDAGVPMPAVIHITETNG